MKLVMIADTHTFHELCTLPDGDVLIHAGDMALAGSIQEVQRCLDWLNKQPHKHIIAIAGNHDWAFQRFKGALQLGRIIYLENSGISIEGKNFYGSPVSPSFCNWAFNADRGPAIKKYWDVIPDNLDVLITHGPPQGIADFQHPTFGSFNLGCADLMNQVEISKPKIHVFGHIHGGYGQKEYKGIKFYNASQVNEAYKIANKPWEVEI
jgi:Icc-related predicted phosphoesterase